MSRWIGVVMVWAILWCSLLEVGAQVPAWRNYSPVDGLPGANVYFGLQDSQGYLWFGTDRGVCRFDGYEFQTFTEADGLPHNTVLRIYEDEVGRIWFSGLFPEVSYFQDGEIHPFSHNAQLRKRFVKAQPTFLHAAGDTLILGLSGRGVVRVASDGTVESDRTVKNLEFGTIDFVHFDGQCYATSASGEVKVVRNLRTDLGARAGEIVPIERRANSLVKSVKSNDGNYLLVTGEEVLRWDGNEEVSTAKFENWPVYLYEDREKHIWVGLKHGGIIRFRNDRLEQTLGPTLLPGLTVTCVFEDHEGGFWFCTEGAGVFYRASLGVRWYRPQFELSGRVVNTLCRGRDGVLFAGFNNGTIDLIDRDSVRNVFIEHNGARNPARVQTILPDPSSGNLIFITSDAAFELNALTGHTTKRLGGVKANITGGMLSRPEGTFLIGSNFGVFELQLGHIHEVREITTGNRLVPATKLIARVIGEGPDGKLLIGNFKELFRLQGDSLFPLASVHPFFSSRITRILPHPEGVLLCSRGQGLALWNERGLRVLTTADGLPSNLISDVAIGEKGHLWLATNRGLCEVYLTTDSARVVRTISTENGLPIREIDRLLVEESVIWIGTHDGLVRLDLDVYAANTTEPPVFISSIQVNQRDTTLPEGAALAHDRNHLQIHFLGLGYRNAGKLSYRYHMEGVAEGWQTTHDRTVQYPTLPPGNYTFSVLAINEHGVASEQPATLSFVILEPWWATWWAISLFVLVAAGAMGGAIWWRLRSLQRKGREEDRKSRQLAEMKLSMLRAQMNPHFTFNTINSILDYIAKDDRRNARECLTKFGRLMRYILESSDRSAVILSEEVKALKLYLELEQYRFGDRLSFTIELDKRLEPDLDEIPSMLVQPVVENAIIHGILPKGGPGTVSINFQKAGELLRVTIEDDGIGRLESAQRKDRSVDGHRSMGTSIIGSRLELLNRATNAPIKLETTDLIAANGQPAGTQVEITIPLT